MAALTDLSDLINRLTGGNSGSPEQPFVFIDGRIGSSAATTPVAGRWTSLWRYNSTYRGSAATPTTVAAPTAATRGALPFTNPGGGREKWLVGFGACGANSAAFGIVVLYDRLLHIGGLSGTDTGAQTVGGTLTRNTSGDGNQIWVEINTIIGTSGTTITASYTNESGTSGRTTQAVAIGGTGLREAERLISLPLADGDEGVQAVASVTLAGSTGTVGDFGVVVARPITTVGVQTQGVWNPPDLISGLPGPRPLESNSCLSLMWCAGNGFVPGLWVSASMVEA